jgi:hypothetical protein
MFLDMSHLYRRAAFAFVIVLAIVGAIVLAIWIWGLSSRTAEPIERVNDLATDERRGAR